MNESLQTFDKKFIALHGYGLFPTNSTSSSAGRLLRNVSSPQAPIRWDRVDLPVLFLLFSNLIFLLLVCLMYKMNWMDIRGENIENENNMQAVALIPSVPNRPSFAKAETQVALETDPPLDYTDSTLLKSPGVHQFCLGCGSNYEPKRDSGHICGMMPAELKSNRPHLTDSTASCNNTCPIEPVNTRRDSDCSYKSDSKLEHNIMFSSSALSSDAAPQIAFLPQQTNLVSFHPSTLPPRLSYVSHMPLRVSTSERNSPVPNRLVPDLNSPLPTDHQLQRTSYSPSSQSLKTTNYEAIQDEPIPYPAVPVAGDVLVALFAYEARSSEELSLSKGQMVTLVDKSNDLWWRVKPVLAETSPGGFVPCAFLALESAVESHEWFAPDVSKRDAERLLLQERFISGTFLVRNSESEQGTFALSVLHCDERTRVAHYRINRSPRGFFSLSNAKVSSARRSFRNEHQFPSLPKLVSYYQSNGFGVLFRGCKLTQPCPITRRTGSTAAPPTVPDLCYATRDLWELDRADISFGDKLGAGNFGVVWRGKWKATVDVAVKSLLAPDNPEAMREFLKESAVMKRLYHPHLVKLYGVCTRGSGPLYIVTELMRDGSLLDSLRKAVERGLEFAFPAQLDMMAQIASGMSYLESQHVVHRDLAARNILVDGSVLKIADFGFARILDDPHAVYSAPEGSRFPFRWTAPEAAERREFSVKSDVWSFGVVMMEVLTGGATPYCGMSNAQCLERVQQGFRMPRPTKCPPALYEIMLHTWNADPQARPSFQELRCWLAGCQQANSSSVEGPQSVPSSSCSTHESANYSGDSYQPALSKEIR